MNLETKDPQFNGLTDESPIESLIYRTVCCPPGFKMETEEVKTFWTTMEPQAGQGTQIIWLADDIDRGSRLARKIAPHAQVRSHETLDAKLRPIVVANPADWLGAMKLGQRFVDSVLITTSGLEEFDGSIAIRSAQMNAPETNLFVIGSFVQASATAAAVVSAYITKNPGAPIAEIQLALMHSASRALGYPALRRV